MPVGAVIGAGALTAGATVVAGSQNSKAINKATAAQTQSNADNVALQRDIYGQNKATLTPFIQRGNAAGNTMNALLGLGGVNDNGTQTLPTQQPNALAAFQGPYADSSAMPRGLGFETMGGDPIGQARQLAASGTPASGQPNALSPQQAANDAFDIFRNSSGYKFRLGEGMNALNSGWAGAGTLQSGAAMKSALKYGQDYASNEFGNYLGYLGNQQGVGLSGASALAGVGQGYANNITSLNQSNANALGNMAVARANNTNGMISGITGAVNTTIGKLDGMGKL